MSQAGDGGRHAAEAARSPGMDAAANPKAEPPCSARGFGNRRRRPSIAKSASNCRLQARAERGMIVFVASRGGGRMQRKGHFQKKLVAKQTADVLLYKGRCQNDSAVKKHRLVP